MMPNDDVDRCILMISKSDQQLLAHPLLLAAGSQMGECILSGSFVQQQSCQVFWIAE